MKRLNVQIAQGWSGRVDPNHRFPGPGQEERILGEPERMVTRTEGQIN